MSENKKVCVSCKQEKELSEYNKSQTNKDGKENKCTQCYKEDYYSRKDTEEYKQEYFTHDKYYQ